MADNQKSDTSEEVVKKSSMPFLEHIEELRRRLIWSLVAIGVMTCISFGFAQYVYEFITAPLGDTKLHFTEITGSFYAYLKISLITGIFAALPIVFYQLWKFIGPGLYKKEKKTILPMAFYSTGLFLAGAAFCFFVVLPFALDFLIHYGEGEMTPIITVSSYISFAGMLLLAFGLAFQLPVVGYFLGRIGVITGKGLGRIRPYALVAILIVAAILTPPDVFSQLLLAVPLYILYEITIIIVKISGSKK
nr:twin-arginine translocase subunit TatC [candidate division Zixibacteria bacterium]